MTARRLCSLHLLAAVLFGGACSGDEGGTERSYEFRPPWDASSGGDTTAADDAVSEDVAGDADTADPEDGTTPPDDAAAADVSIPKITCQDDGICQEVLGALTGPCAAARCQDGLCALAAFADGQPCDDGLLCTAADSWVGGLCQGTAVVCETGAACSVGLCDPATGKCASTSLSGAEFACDDGAACTVDDHCTSGACKGAPKSCDDGEACTVDACDAATGACENDGAPREGDPCNDASVCTSGDTCTLGLCRGAEKDCDDGNPCSADTCLAASGACSHGVSPAIEGLQCDDGDACTLDDVCASGACLGAVMLCPAGACEVAGCVAGACLPPVSAADGALCEDGSACTTADACAGGVCVGAPIPCDDGSACTLDLCDPASGCASTPLGEGAPCDDGDLCTDGDICAAVGCVGAARACDDANPCTTDACAPATGVCGADPAPMNGAPCDVDGDLCTTGGACVSGVCGGEVPVACGDGNPCTTDACDAATGTCLNSPLADGTGCTDGVVCTAPDRCTSGACVGTTRSCDDGNECTADACTEDAGCAHAPISGCLKPLHPCNVSTALATTQPAVTQCVCAADPTCCTFGWSAQCVALAQTVCGMSCGSCAAAPVACKLDADCGFCDPDGNLCDGGWRCDTGACKPTAAVVCDSSTDTGCLRTRCVPETGECGRSPRADLCDDDTVCTIDACTAGGQCSSTTRANCSEQHPCQTSSKGASSDAAVTECVCTLDDTCCTASWGAGCVQLAQEQCALTCDCAALPPSATACTTDGDCKKCDDADLCNGGWRCVAGQCGVTGAVDCSGLGCLDGACDAATGTCDLTPDPASCDDRDGCTADACIAATGACTHHPVPGCGTQGPCETSTLGRSSDADVTECVCEQLPECCTEAWTSACVTAAHFACGASCGCAAAPPSCTTEADCASCDDANVCNGGWTCAGGTCSRTPGPTCDTSANVGCRQSVCESATGICSLQALTSACDDGLPCTVDACSSPSGACIHTPNAACGANHPCQVSALPESSDPAVTACVCALDVSCCTRAWSDDCVALAQGACGQAYDCRDLPPAAKTCNDTEDCWVCNESPCSGTWTCSGGQCVSGGAVVCGTSNNRGCVQEACDAITGTCQLDAQNAACPTVGCQGGLCDFTSGKCGFEPIPGCVAPVDLCVASPLPATVDDPVAACVCAYDPDCCGAAWDQRCADRAVQVCGLKCGCDALLPAQLACVVDADCAGCDDNGDRCDGTWRCEGGHCGRAGPVECGQTSGDCNSVSCDPETGACVVGGDPSRCDDAKACTIDACSATTGQCTHAAIAGCGTNSPCTTAATPGSASPAVTQCTCAKAPECCTEAWTAACVGLAQAACGLACEVCPPGGCVGSLEPSCPDAGCTGTDSSALLCALDVCFSGLGVEAGLGVSSPNATPLDGTFGAFDGYGATGNGLGPRSGASCLVLSTSRLDQRPHSDVLGGAPLSDPWTGSTTPAMLSDTVEVTLSLKAPAGATGFSLDTLFLSVELPEYVGSSYIDAFYVILQAPVTTSGQPVIINAGPCADPEAYTDFATSGTPQCYTGVNSAFVLPCDGTGLDLSGSGFECGLAEANGGSSTSWLRTMWPVQPGEAFTLRFHIHDAVDGSHDSAALVDRFRWVTGAVGAGTAPAP